MVTFSVQACRSNSEIAAKKTLKGKIDSKGCIYLNTAYGSLVNISNLTVSSIRFRTVSACMDRNSGFVDVMAAKALIMYMSKLDQDFRIHEYQIVLSALMLVETST